MEYRLDELFDLQMGKTPSRNNPEYWNSEDHKWISIGDLSKCGKYILDTKEYLSDTAVQESGISCIPANTVIMSFKLSIGKTAITKEPIYSNEAIMSFRDKHIVELLPDYIFYMFTGKDWEAGTNKAVMGKTLNKATLSAIKVSIHPISEQRRIVEVLDKASSIIEDRQRELTRLDELIRARFVEMFGDPVKNDKGFDSKLGSEVFKLSNGKFVPEDKRFDSGIPVYGGNGISWFTDELLFEKDTIVVGRVGFQSGNVHLVGGPLWVSDNAMYISSFYDDGYDLQFLFAVMEHIDFTRFQDAGDLKKITQKPFMQMLYIKPPIEMQQEYNAFVAQVDKSKYQAEPNSRKYYIHRLRKQYQELTDSLFLYFTKLFEVIIFQKGIC